MNRPINRCIKGITFVELAIFAAVLLISLAGLYSWIQGHAIRKHVAEALLVAQSAKSAIETTCTEDSTLQNLNSRLLGYRFKPSIYVANISLGGSCEDPQIRLVTMNTGLEPDLSITIVGKRSDSNGSVVWTCQSDGLDIHLPKICQS